MKPLGAKALLQNSSGQTTSWQSGQIITEKVVWLPLNSLEERFLYPTFFKNKLNPLPNAVEHIVTWE
jgi:hypothetical protein